MKVADFASTSVDGFRVQDGAGVLSHFALGEGAPGGLGFPLPSNGRVMVPFVRDSLVLMAHHPRRQSADPHRTHAFLRSANAESL